jgi:hypothetical protein
LVDANDLPAYLCAQRSTIAMHLPRMVAALAGLIFPVAVSAAPTAVGEGFFGAGTVTYPFPATGAPAFPGITFSSPNPPLQFGDTTTWDVSSPGVNTLIFSGLTLILDVPTSAIGFIFGGNKESLVTLTVGLTGGSFTTVDLTVAADDAPADGVQNWRFYGFADAAGINSLSFGVDSLIGSFVGLGELRSLPFTPVPEPAALAVLGAGLVGLAAIRRRRRPAASMPPRSLS